MNRNELTHYVAGQLATSRLQARVLVDAVLAGIEHGLKTEQHVSLARFGTLQVLDRHARKGRNPHTGATITLPAGNRVAWRASSALRNAVKR